MDGENSGSESKDNVIGYKGQVKVNATD